MVLFGLRRGTRALDPAEGEVVRSGSQRFLQRGRYSTLVDRGNHLLLQAASGGERATVVARVEPRGNLVASRGQLTRKVGRELWCL